MSKTWLGTYAFDADHTTVATLADPAAVAAMREPTIERGYGGGYGDADARSRSAFVRRMREDSDRAAADAEREQAREARVERDYPRAARIDSRIDALCGDLAKVERLQLIWEQWR
jgi:hypothetical protein